MSNDEPAFIRSTGYNRPRGGRGLHPALVIFLVLGGVAGFGSLGWVLFGLEGKQKAREQPKGEMPTSANPADSSPQSSAKEDKSKPSIKKNPDLLSRLSHLDSEAMTSFRQRGVSIDMRVKEGLLKLREAIDAFTKRQMVDFTREEALQAAVIATRMVAIVRTASNQPFSDETVGRFLIISQTYARIGGITDELWRAWSDKISEETLDAIRK